MADLRGSIFEFYSLEQLAGGTSVLHKLDTRAKIAGTFIYIIAVLSFRAGEISGMTPFVLYPAIAIPLADIPQGMILKRCAVALPFCLFAGLSSLFFDRTVIFTLCGFSVTSGMMIMAAILFRALLCVSAVLILMAVTPFRDLTAGLRAMHIPTVFIVLFEMTYRYIGILVAEALLMYTAYSLRSGGKKGVDMRDMGSFVGHLLLRSFSRAERVWQAMKCRGYNGTFTAASGNRAIRRDDVLFLTLICGMSILFRLVNIPYLIGGFITCLM